MKNLFYDEVVYECDLGEMSFAEFLPHWVEKESIFYWSTWKKGLNEGYSLSKKKSDNHFIVVQQTGDRFPPTIEIEYINKTIIIQFYHKHSSYLYILLPLILNIIALFYGFPLKSIWFGLGFSFYLFICHKGPYEGKKETIKHDLELEFRYQKIKYAVKDGETYYPIS